MIRGEAWSLFERIAQRSKIAASALSRHTLYTCRTCLGAHHRFDASYVCAVLHRMDGFVCEWERARVKKPCFKPTQIQGIVVLVQRAHDHVARYTQAIAPLLKQLQLQALPVEHEKDVQDVLRGTFDCSLKRFEGSGVFTPLANSLQRLQFDASRRIGLSDGAAGRTADPASGNSLRGGGFAAPASATEFPLVRCDTEPLMLELTDATHSAEAEGLELQIRRGRGPGATLGLHRRIRGEPGERIGNLWGFQVFAQADVTLRFPRYHRMSLCLANRASRAACGATVQRRGHLRNLRRT